MSTLFPKEKGTLSFGRNGKQPLHPLQGEWDLTSLSLNVKRLQRLLRNEATKHELPAGLSIPKPRRHAEPHRGASVTAFVGLLSGKSRPYSGILHLPLLNT